MYYPIVLKIGGRPVVVIGGGEVAESKVKSLLEAGARVTVVSPEFTAALRKIARAGDITIVEREYTRSDLKDAFFVIAATDNPATQEQIWLDARDSRVLVNMVDEPARCDFIMPSVLRRDDLIVAVSTSGKSPAFAAWLQRRLSEIVTPEFGRVVSLLGGLRQVVRQRFTTVSQRKRAYQQVIDSGIVNWIGDCDDATAKTRIRSIIQGL